MTHDGDTGGEHVVPRTSYAKRGDVKRGNRRTSYVVRGTRQRAKRANGKAPPNPFVYTVSWAS